MSTKVPKLKTFTITARVVVISDVEIEADSYEAAVVKAKDLEVTDLVTVDGSYNEGSIRIASINQAGVWAVDED
jgi:hypothetical protein